jgi:hypothetical protein
MIHFSVMSEGNEIDLRFVLDETAWKCRQYCNRKISNTDACRASCQEESVWALFIVRKRADAFINMDHSLRLAMLIYEHAIDGKACRIIECVYLSLLPRGKQTSREI